MDENPWPQPAPGQTPQDWQPWQPEQQTNPVAVWSWVLALPCALAGLALGVVGLVLARRRGGAGRVHAVVGIAASSTVLVLGALAASVAVVLAPGAGSIDDLAASRGQDGTAGSMTAEEQHFIDGLYDETYQAFDDSTLLEMGYAFCVDLDAGESAPQADADLVAAWDGLDLDAAYDVEWEATHHLCPGHAEGFEAWDPAQTDGQGDVGTVDV